MGKFHLLRDADLFLNEVLRRRRCVNREQIFLEDGMFLSSCAWNAALGYCHLIEDVIFEGVGAEMIRPEVEI